MTESIIGNVHEILDRSVYTYLTQTEIKIRKCVIQIIMITKCNCYNIQSWVHRRRSFTSSTFDVDLLTMKINRTMTCRTAESIVPQSYKFISISLITHRHSHISYKQKNLHHHPATSLFEIVRSCQCNDLKNFTRNFKTSNTSQLARIECFNIDKHIWKYVIHRYCDVHRLRNENTFRNDATNRSPKYSRHSKYITTRFSEIRIVLTRTKIILQLHTTFMIFTLQSRNV